MCAQFALRVKLQELTLRYGILTPNHFNEISERFLPYKMAPVLVEQKQAVKLVGMQFSLVPSWSKESKVKFATHNARIETITEKPTWKIPFERFHCVIPMTSFFESVYEGPQAGHTIEFSELNGQILFAAGIFDLWRDDITQKELFSFSILTKEPSSFIAEQGHDRMPIFLSYDNAKTWLTLKQTSEDMVEFLKTRSVNPDLSVQIDRPLKKGWENRK